MSEADLKLKWFFTYKMYSWLQGYGTGKKEKMENLIHIPEHESFFREAKDKKAISW